MQCTCIWIILFNYIHTHIWFIDYRLKEEIVQLTQEKRLLNQKIDDLTAK